MIFGKICFPDHAIGRCMHTLAEYPAWVLYKCNTEALNSLTENHLHSSLTLMEERRASRDAIQQNGAGRDLEMSRFIIPGIGPGAPHTGK